MTTSAGFSACQKKNRTKFCDNQKDNFEQMSDEDESTAISMMHFSAEEHCTNYRGFPSIKDLAGVEAALGGIRHAGIATHTMESNRPDVALAVEGRTVKHHLQNRYNRERERETENSSHTTPK